jgi:hypothetical protein
MRSNAALIRRFKLQRQQVITTFNDCNEIAHPVYQLVMSAFSPVPPACPSLP